MPRHAAALAFFTMLTLAPMLLALTGIAGYFLGTEQVASQILSGVRRGLGAQAAQGIEQLVQRTVLQGSGAGARTIDLPTRSGKYAEAFFCPYSLCKGGFCTPES